MVEKDEFIRQQLVEALYNRVWEPFLSTAYQLLLQGTYVYGFIKTQRVLNEVKKAFEEAGGSG